MRGLQDRALCGCRLCGRGCGHGVRCYAQGTRPRQRRAGPCGCGRCGGCVLLWCGARRLCWRRLRGRGRCLRHGAMRGTSDTDASAEKAAWSDKDVQSNKCDYYRARQGYVKCRSHGRLGRLQVCQILPVLARKYVKSENCVQPEACAQCRRQQPQYANQNTVDLFFHLSLIVSYL